MVVVVAMSTMLFILFMSLMTFARHPLLTHFMGTCAVEILSCGFGFLLGAEQRRYTTILGLSLARY